MGTIAAAQGQAVSVFEGAVSRVLGAKYLGDVLLR